MATETNQALVSVGISVSPCEDAEAIGYDERQINRIVIRIAQYFLYKNMRVIFGHDWRENGVMHAVLNCAEIAGAAIEPQNGEPRMLNLVSTLGAPASGIATDAQRAARGVLEVRTLRDHLKVSGDGARVPGRLRQADELSVLRYCLTKLLNPGYRICLGGRTCGFEGHYAGVAEEAYFALAMNKPLYVVGGFGGAAAAVCAALEGKEWADGYEALRPMNYADDRGLNWHHMPPSEGIDRLLRDFGLETLSRANGLDHQENRQLFVTTDIEAALGLIWRGMNNVLSLAS